MTCKRSPQQGLAARPVAFDALALSRRRALAGAASLTGAAALGGVATLALTACAAEGNPTSRAEASPARDRPAPARVISGGFLSPPTPAFGLPARPGTGVFARFVAPSALALRGNDLLVLDPGLQRLWRVDIGLGTMSAIAGAPTLPGTTLALGPDLSAWVLDAPGAAVLRFARDGRLLQSVRLPPGLPAAAGGLAMVDGDATLLVATGTPRWIELRPLGGVGTEVGLRGDDGLARVDAIATTGSDIVVLDRGAARVLVARRDGTVIARLGDGVLKQPHAIAAGRDGSVHVLDPFDHSVKRFGRDGSIATLDMRALGVTRPVAIARDERWLAIADLQAAQVTMHVLTRDGGA